MIETLKKKALLCFFLYKHTEAQISQNKYYDVQQQNNFFNKAV